MAVRTITKQKDLENWLPLLVSAVLAIGLLYFSQRKLVELGTAALGQQTAAVLGQDDGLRFTCSDAADSELCENAYRQVGGLSSAIWLGNSQNFAINHYKRGDKLAVAIVHEWLKDRKSWLVSYTQPNANLYEQAVVFEAAAQRYNPRLLILPVFMDDFREQGIRPEVVAFIGDGNEKCSFALPEWPELVSLWPTKMFV
jgi:hypothetical protein